MVVKAEPLKKNTKIVSQCKRCQGYNHTQAYCRKEPRCVKCAGKHFTRNCNISRQTTPKCINCGGSHPANYRGCEVAKELQKRRKQVMKPRKQKAQLSNKEKLCSKKTEEGMESKLTTSSSRTFAQVAMIDNKINKDTDHEKLGTFVLILRKLDEQIATNKMLFDRLNKLESIIKQKSNVSKRNGLP